MLNLYKPPRFVFTHSFAYSFFAGISGSPKFSSIPGATSLMLAGEAISLDASAKRGEGGSRAGGKREGGARTRARGGRGKEGATSEQGKVKGKRKLSFSQP